MMRSAAFRALSSLAVLASFAAAFASCRGREAAAPAASAGANATASGGELHVYIWSAYLPDAVVEEFRRRTGVEVTVDVYDSNEALLAKLQSGVADYDLVVPSDYMMRILAHEHLLQPLDRSKITTLGNLDPRFLDKDFDRGNRYSVPYLWGTTGLGYDRKKLGAIDSWAVLFDPRHKGRILMLDDVREVFGVALRTMGRSINERDPKVLAQAAELLERQKPLVATYDSGDFANVLAAGDVDLAHGYNGQLAAAVAADPQRLAYVVPKEGGTLWMDSTAIPAKARNVANALRFISYVQEPEVNARIVDGVHYASANVPARKLIAPAILGDKAIYPDDTTLARCELLADLGDATTVLDRLWTEVKSQ
ncbi:MAG TPA: spermidine/putrescine ABC transporter substrate-binding protein [Thermoanaerobaculia bacterium]|jgi:spermidine/putrescine-binding protein|nr:spermidine/putrescine ABC transporter substrate-binding protein [Thermoanaerobaculia bacterium]